MIDTAIIFAAGLGSRMQSHENGVPKPITRICQRTLIDIVIRQIVDAGLKRVIINVHYKAKDIIAHLRQQDNAVPLTIVEEPELLETGGSLINMLRLLHIESPVVTCNVDTIWTEKDGTESQIAQLLKTWPSLPHDKKLLLLVADQLKGAPPERRDFAVKGGALHIGGNAQHYYIGSQIIDPAVLLPHENDRAFSLSKVYRNLADENGMLRGAYALDFSGRDVFHVGDQAALKAAQEYCTQSYAQW
jgi:MurNAc alpha-1-phosphate uridylyltransferase